VLANNTKLGHRTKLGPTLCYLYILCAWRVSLYKILFHFKALLWESIILLLLPFTCKVYPIAIPFHDHCAIYARPLTPPFVAVHYAILVMAILCKGVNTNRERGGTTGLRSVLHRLDYNKIFVHFSAFVNEPILILLPPLLSCNAHTVTIGLQDYCARYTPPRTHAHQHSKRAPTRAALVTTVETRNVAHRARLWRYSRSCISIYLPAYLPTYLPTYPSSYLPTYLPTYARTHVCTYLPTYYLTHLPTYLSF